MTYLTGDIMAVCNDPEMGGLSHVLSSFAIRRAAIS
jgi:hypothetical protein